MWTVRSPSVRRQAALGPVPVKRRTFVIGRDRRVIDAITSELNMDVHADKALAALRAPAH